MRLGKNMRIRSFLKLTWLAGIILLVALSLHEYHGAKQARAKRIEAAAQQNRMEAAIKIEALRAASLEQECQVMEKFLSNRINPVSATPSEKKASVTGQIELLMNDTQLQTLHLALEHSRLAERYRPFFLSSALSPEQVELVYALLMKREEQRMDLADVATLTRSDVDDQTVEKLKRRLDDNLRREMAGMIGEANAMSFSAYERILPAWQLVSRFAGISAVGGDPLSVGQSTALAQIVAEASPAYRAGGITDLNTVDWRAAVSTATQVLTEPQVQSFSNSAPRYPVKDQRGEPLEIHGSFDFRFYPTSGSSGFESKSRGSDQAGSGFSPPQ
jgi:hypothetical protein